MDTNKKTKSRLKVGDVVMIVAGGNKKKRPLKGKTGKILRFVGSERNRVIVEGLNHSIHHERDRSATEKGGKIQKESAISISNVMYYVEKLKAPVKLTTQVLKDGKKVRGYIDPKSKQFTQI